MPRAVIFDFYGTLAHWSDAEATSYTAILAGFGYTLPPAELDAYFRRYDGIEHLEHSADEQAYEAWVRHRLGELLAVAGVSSGDHEAVLDALRASDQSDMTAYPDADPILRDLQAAGLRLAVCSNWGWELDAYLAQIGLLSRFDLTITSARAGARKPHRRVYDVTLDALGVAPTDVVFVGDSWEPDVIGPSALGMTAVHVWRAQDRAGLDPPALDDGVHRVGDLSELRELLSLS